MAEFTNDKMLPQSLEAEQAVLAAMFNDRDAILEVIPLLKESDFYLSNSQKQSIYNAIEKSGNQLVGVKYNIFDPELCKYAMYIYIKLKENKYSKELVENSVRSLIGGFFTNIKLPWP